MYFNYRSSCLFNGSTCYINCGPFIFSESIFGRFKIKIENQLMRLSPGKYVIARLPMVFGINAPRTLQIDHAIHNNESIEVFPNSIINVNSDIRLSQQIHYLINHKKNRGLPSGEY